MIANGSSLTILPHYSGAKVSCDLKLKLRSPAGAPQVKPRQSVGDRSRFFAKTAASSRSASRGRDLQ